jgi:hypothetical protein
MPRRKSPKDRRSLTRAEAARLRRKWRSWIVQIADDLGNLFHSRDMFQGLNEIGQHNARIADPDAFLEWVRLNYAIALSVGVRRLTDNDSRSISLARLLTELQAYPQAVTRVAHSSFYPPHLRETAAISSDNLLGRGRRFLSRQLVRSDLARIRRAESRIRRFVNKRIAHRATAGAIRKLPTYAELHQSLDVLDRIVVKYYALLTGRGLVSCHASILFNWREVFYAPWIPPGSPLRP